MATKTMFGYIEQVDHPAHYNMGHIEVIDAIEDWGLDFALGNAVKYIARAQYKGNMKEDLEKAIWYIRRAIDGVEGAESVEDSKEGEAGDNG